MLSPNFRKVLRRHYNWSTIRHLLQWHWPGAWLLLSVIPILFAFVYDINTSFFAQPEAKIVEKSPQRQKLAQSVDKSHDITIQMGWGNMGSNEVISWSHTLQILFFATLAYSLARFFHNANPLGDMLQDADTYAQGIMTDASRGDPTAVEIMKEEALVTIEEYERLFGERIPVWANTLDDDERKEDLKTVRAGASAKYHLDSTKRVILLCIVSFLYLSAGVMLLIVLCFRSYIVLRGTGQ